MTSKRKKVKNEENEINEKLIRTFQGETPEEILKYMSGIVPEKDIKAIMKNINDIRDKQKESTDDIPEEHQRLIKKAIKSAINKVNETSVTSSVTLLSTNQHPTFIVNKKAIHIYTTSSATHIVPFLFATPVNLEMTLKVSPPISDNSLSLTIPENKQEYNFNLETDMKGCDGMVPSLVISHKCENNNNETSISQIIEYLQKHFSEYIDIEDVECYGNSLSVKRITFK